MMAELKHISTDRMIETFWAVMKKDSGAVTNCLINLELIVRTNDMRSIERVIEFLLDRFTDRPVDVREFHLIKSEITALFIHQPFQISPEMSFILKALSTLDGIARTLDPEYNLVTAAQPFIRSVAVSNGGNLVSKLGKQATNYFKYKLDRPSASTLLIKQLEQRLEQSELENSRRAQTTDRLVQLVYLAIYNLIYLCLTGFSAIAAILLISIHPLWSAILWGITSLSGLIWLRSLVLMIVQSRLLK
jgi:predicted unusual protein kinase regulating ubiquinone biosynthesis (AarF/ABC1/UbiB family)